MAARDVTQEQFDAQVIEASRTRAVVVDFWAPWCGPCHQLAPVLERVAERHAGEVDLVKLNVDEAPALAQRYRIQGIPAIKAFRDGAVVAELTGVQPEPVLERLFAGLAPSEADRLVAEAAGSPDPQPLLDKALAADPGHRTATLARARLHADAGEVDDARALLGRIPPDDEVRRLLAELNLAGSSAVDVDALRAAAEAGDEAAALDLGRALIARGQHADGLEVLLGAVRRPATREPARAAMIEAFEVLGADHELVARYRPKLASALF